MKRNTEKSVVLLSDTLFSDYKVTGLSKIRGYQRNFTVVSPKLTLKIAVMLKYGEVMFLIVFNEKTNQWEYGIQCSRKKREGEDYCGIHLRKLPHGDIKHDPPHRHFENHKKIDLKICHG